MRALFDIHDLKISRRPVLGLLKWSIEAYICSMKLMRTGKYDMMHVRSLTSLYPRFVVLDNADHLLLQDLRTWLPFPFVISRQVPTVSLVMVTNDIRVRDVLEINGPEDLGTFPGTLSRFLLAAHRVESIFNCSAGISQKRKPQRKSLNRRRKGIRCVDKIR